MASSLKVLLDNPIVVEEDGETVVYDHLWLGFIFAPNISSAKPVEMRFRLLKARDLPNGTKRFYRGEPPVDVSIDDLFLMMMTDPGKGVVWGEILVMILQQVKLLAREQGKTV